jgi:S-DNA-T family DNA segregation ATPase FtsK/SpoIIIE
MLALIQRSRGAAPTALLRRADHPGKSVDRSRRLYIGVGGDDLVPVTVRLPGGGVLAVLGGPGSGKSSLLAALPVLNRDCPNQDGPAWLQPDPGLDPEDYWAEIHRDAVAGRLARDALLLVDDADRLPAATNQKLLEVSALGLSVILSANFGQTLMQRVPLAMAARNCGSGILIAPRSHMDGDLFGLRFELDPNPPPGRAILLSNGRGTPVQLAGPAESAPAGTPRPGQ